MAEAASATARQSLPATRMSTSWPAISLAAAIALRVAGLSALLSCSATTRAAIRSPVLSFPRKRESRSDSLLRRRPWTPAFAGVTGYPLKRRLSFPIELSDHPRLGFELVDQLGDRADFMAALPFWRLFDLEHDQARRHVDTERLRRRRDDRLFLCPHDIRQRGVARLVEPQIGRDHRRQSDCDGFEPAIDLACYFGVAVADLELGGEGRLRPTEQCRHHLTGLIAIVVDRLLADDDDLGAFLEDHRLQELGDGKRLKLGGGFYQDAAIGAHR